jgi:hypothetical protein
MSDQPQQEAEKRKRPARRSDPRALQRFLQELSWLLASYEDLDFRALQQQVERAEPRRPRSLFDHAGDQSSAAAFLVGTLPDLFQDEAVFPSDEDIADFAQHALGVIIPRWSKKSKYEIIGHVVCHTSVADETRLRRVVGALERLTHDRERASNLITENKAQGMTWNELIQKLIRDE